jgi:hypothetical protein
LKTATTARCRKQPKKRKCLCCKGDFTPDPRNKHHQKYCTKPACRQASKKASPQKWLSSDKGCGYFTGSFNVDRVKKWRKKHPGYWKRTASKQVEPLQDLLASQGTENKEDTVIRDLSPHDALQDLSFLQPALFIGLIASLTGSTLQDDIAKTTLRFIDSG